MVFHPSFHSDPDYRLLSLDELDADQIEAIRALRNSHDVRRYMYNSDIIPKDEHLTWIAAIRNSETDQVFAVCHAAQVVGLLAFRAIDRANKRCDWAFYLDGSTRGKGVGSSLERAALKHAFETLDLYKLNCEVIASNDAVIALHKRFGFVEEGRRRAHVWRSGEPEDAVLLGITRPDWDSVR